MLGIFSIASSVRPIKLKDFLEAFSNAKGVAGKGRGGIKIFFFEDKAFFGRKYMHGGLLRFLTRDLFLSSRRAEEEFDLLHFLYKKGYPVPSPFCVIAERLFFFKRLYIVQEWKSETQDLVEALNSLKGLKRLRLIRDFALELARFQKEGLLFRDLHLRNVIVGKEGKVCFVDFDRVNKGKMDEKQLINCIRRLERYAEKMEWKGNLTIKPKEKAFFLRIYKKSIGSYKIERACRMYPQRKVFYRIGWFFESLLYGGV